MTIAETLLPEFDTEMATTRRLLDRVPDGKGERNVSEARAALAVATDARFPSIYGPTADEKWG